MISAVSLRADSIEDHVPSGPASLADVMTEDPGQDYPDRFVLIGLSRQLRVLFVVSAEAGDRIRIMRARKASPAQRKVYENGP